jgi:multiple sugar transport system substrate-binding protein
VVTVIALTMAAGWPAFRFFFAGLTDDGTVAAWTKPSGAPRAGSIVGTPVVPGNTGPVTLTLLAPKYGPAVDHAFWDTVTADFHAAYPDITVQVELVDRADLVATVNSRLPGPDAPDLFLGVLADQVRAAAFEGKLYSAYDIVGPPDNMLPFFTYCERAGPGYYGPQFGIPFTANTLELYYNKRLFSRAHITAPPASWAEIAADAAKIKALGRTGYGLALGAPDAATTAQLWLASIPGGGFMDGSKSQWTVNMPSNVDTLQWLRDNLVRPGRVEAHPGTRSTRDLEKDFAAGNLGMLVADRGLIAQTKAGALGTAFGVTPIPGRGGGRVQSIGFVDDLLATKAHANRRLAIGEFVNFLLLPKYQQRFANLNGTLPVTQAASDAEGQDPLLKPFTDGMAKADWLPYRVPTWPAVAQRIRSDLPAALTGDPKAVLDRIQTFAMSAQ